MRYQAPGNAIPVCGLPGLDVPRRRAGGRLTRILTSSDLEFRPPWIGGGMLGSVHAGRPRLAVFDDQAHRHQQLLLVEDHVPASRFEVADTALAVGDGSSATGHPDLVGQQFHVILVDTLPMPLTRAPQQQERGFDDYATTGGGRDPSSAEGRHHGR